MLARRRRVPARAPRRPTSPASTRANTPSRSARSTRPIIDPTPATVRWRVDLTAPDSQISSGPDALTNDATPTFEFEADEPGSTFECRFDAGNWETCSSPLTPAALSEGDHELEVRATDRVRNVESDPATRSFNVDLTAPATEITSGPAEGPRSRAPPRRSASTRPTGCGRLPVQHRRVRLGALPVREHAELRGTVRRRAHFSVRSSTERATRTRPRRCAASGSTPGSPDLDRHRPGLRRAQPGRDLRVPADDPKRPSSARSTGAPSTAAPRRRPTRSAARAITSSRPVPSTRWATPTPARRPGVDGRPERRAPPDRPSKPKKSCYFETDLPRCGEPFMRARATALPAAGSAAPWVRQGRPQGERRRSALTKVRFALPPQLRLRFDGDARAQSAGSSSSASPSGARTSSAARGSAPVARRATPPSGWTAQAADQLEDLPSSPPASASSWRHRA